MKEKPYHPHPPIAIIGMGCFFPKAAGLRPYWRNLFHGIDCIDEVPASHWSPADYFDENPQRADHVYCKRGGFLSPVLFDPIEFGIPPSSLEATDTSQLIGLLCAKMALDDAGYGDGRLFDRERTSVVLGVTGTQELVIPLSSRLGYPIWRRALEESGIPGDTADTVVARISGAYVGWQENSFPGLLGNVVAGRISNRLNLGGTNCVVDAACASSLSAVHVALMELTTGRSDMVITGGVDTLNDIFMHMCFSKTRVLSPSGDARPFSRRADGTVLGEGIGMVVLKRLADAENDGDRIYAVIRAIGSSSDGRSQSIYAPRPEGQIRALKKAYGSADIDPETVELVEAHGTGTRVGDKMEFQALCQVFGPTPGRPLRRCAIGSVKSMIGHAKAAAGAAGLIKTVLALHHKVIPPTLKAEEPDPELKMEQSPFYLNTESRPWFSRPSHRRRAGLSAFGFGGSNFHTVLEEYRSDKPETAWAGAVQIFAFSAPRVDELKAQVAKSRREIKDGRPAAAQASESRKSFVPGDFHRLLLVFDAVGSPDEKAAAAALLSKAVDMLSAYTPENALIKKGIYYGTGTDRPKVAMMFPGQGSQYVGMGRDLICVFPEAFSVLDDAHKILRHLGETIYPIPARSRDECTNQELRLRDTALAQPAVGAVSLAFLNVLKRFGVLPDATCGHSFGELIALCAAGWIDTGTALRLSVLRGQAMAAAAREHSGGMLAVYAPLDDLETLLTEMGSDLSLANRNSPTQGVLSGPSGAIDRADARCRQIGFKTKRLPVSAAFHTSHMAPARDAFRRMLDTIEITPTAIPVYSNVTGETYPADPGKTKSLLSDQLVRSVNFVENIENLCQSGIRTFVEVGPHSILTGLIRSNLSKAALQSIPVDATRGKENGVLDLAGCLCHLAASGYAVDLKGWEDPVIEKAGKQRMQIALLGANYRNPRPDVPPLEAIQVKAGVETAASAYTPKKSKDIMKQETADLIADALRVAKEGLQSIQALQLQTAETHKKFLETQAETGRVLQEMMANTQRMTRLLLGDVKPEPVFLSEMPTVDSARGVHATPEPAETPEMEPAQPVREPELTGSSGIRRTLLDIVSRLTGYPVDMLDADMDIEADLGIDSIKRVEILSAMEEAMPELPKVSPEQMGSLKTLRDITGYLEPRQRAHSPSRLGGTAGNLQSKSDVGRSEPDSHDIVGSTLLAIVSRLTGYPVDMLDADMDIEADLGIDSIKRVEILSAMEEAMPELPKVSPEQMGSLKTLGQIVSFLYRGDAEIVVESPKTGTFLKSDPAALAVGRYYVTRTETPYVRGYPIHIPRDRTIYVTPGADGLSDALVSRIKIDGGNAVSFSPHEISNEGRPKCGGVLILPGTDPETAFRIAHSLAPEILQSAEKSGAVFATIARMDGAFGFRGKGFEDPLQGGLAGLTKTAAAEWPDVLCRAFDIAPDWQDYVAIADSIVDELFYPDARGLIEIGLEKGVRSTFTLEPATYPDGAPDIRPEDVFVITGGARGITASVALYLAQTFRCTLVLLGRSGEPEPEPPWLLNLTDAGAIKKAIVEHEFPDVVPTPLAVEKVFVRRMKNREISENLEKMRNTGARIIYRSLDLRNAEAVGNTFREICAACGSVSGIIHGAGVLRDRKITEKTRDDFTRVFSTKINGLHAILTAMKEQPIKYLMLFSSVAARIGNPGQSDYAMANEVLNKTAQLEALRRPGCKVVSINWGPWDGGMVSDGLKRAFGERGIPLISRDVGARIAVNELGRDPEDPAEVVIGATALSAEESRPRPLKNLGLSLSFQRQIDLEGYPILSAHVLDGKPVVPFALFAEWLSHGALHSHPGLLLHGLDDFRLYSGIRMDGEKREIRLLTGKLTRNGSFFEVDVQIRDGIKDDREVVHSSAKAVLAEAVLEPPAYQIPVDIESGTFHRPAHEIYEKILFHGEALRGIRRIINLTPEGMCAELSSAPSPARWIKEPIRSRWILDPLVLDSAFQMASVWCHETTGNVSLPIYCNRYRQFCDIFPKEGVKAVLEVKSTTDRKMLGDFTFLDANYQVVARLTGYEAVMDPGLINAFKPHARFQNA